MDNVAIIKGAEPQQIADWLARFLQSALEREGAPLAINMPGGSTPFPILAALIERAPCLPWGDITVWPGDDRIVDEAHDASNIGRIRASLAPTAAQICPLEAESAPPAFALTWLGMGSDGHIASLFPSSDPAIDDSARVRRITPNPLPPEAPFDRVTLTIPALVNTGRILMTLGGSAEKLDVFNRALASEEDWPVTRLLEAAAKRGIGVTCFT